MKNETFARLVLVAAIICIFFGFAVTTPDEAPALVAAEKAGLKDPKILDSGWWSTLHGCGKDDGRWYSVLATNPAGQRTQMTICCGVILKGCTVRY